MSTQPSFPDGSRRAPLFTGPGHDATAGGPGGQAADGWREELERRLAAVDRESEALGRQRDAIRQAVAEEVDRTWTSPWKSPDTVDAKLRARLAGHGEYQALRVRQRELDEERRGLLLDLEHGGRP